MRFNSTSAFIWFHRGILNSLDVSFWSSKASSGHVHVDTHCYCLLFCESIQLGFHTSKSSQKALHLYCVIVSRKFLVVLQQTVLTIAWPVKNPIIFLRIKIKVKRLSVAHSDFQRRIFETFCKTSQKISFIFSQ